MGRWHTETDKVWGLERGREERDQVPLTHSEHTRGCMARSASHLREGCKGQEETVTRMWITCSGSSPSTATPFTSTSLSPAYNKPRQPGTQNKEGDKDIGKDRGTYPKAL